MAAVISMVNGKGGVGKTTTVTNLGFGLAMEMGWRVLLVDLDPQASLTIGLGVEVEQPNRSMHAVMTRSRELEEILVGVGDREGRTVDLAPADLSMIELERRISGEIAFHSILGKALSRVSNDYDLVLIDCRPSLESLEINALCAADRIVIPISADRLAQYATERYLIPFYREVKEELHPELDILGVLLTKYDKRNAVCRETQENVYRYFGDLTFQTMIRVNTTLAQVPGRGRSILDYDTRSRGAEDYRALCEEVVNRV